MPSASPLTIGEPGRRQRGRKGFGIGSSPAASRCGCRRSRARAREQVAAPEAIERRAADRRFRATRADSRRRPRRRAHAPARRARPVSRRDASASGPRIEHLWPLPAERSGVAAPGVAATTRSGLPNARSNSARGRGPMPVTWSRTQASARASTFIVGTRGGGRPRGPDVVALRLADVIADVDRIRRVEHDRVRTRSNTRNTNMSPMRSSGRCDESLRLIESVGSYQRQIRSGSLEGRGSGIGSEAAVDREHRADVEAVARCPCRS